MNTATQTTGRSTITVDTGAFISFAENGTATLTIDGSRGPLTSNYDRLEVQERIIADVAAPGGAGAAYIAAVRAKDVRAQRRAWRLIGVPAE